MAPFSSLRATLTQAYPPAPAFTEANAPPGSQTGRVFVVTGGIAGVGLELCRILYTSGATVYMASRSQTKAEAVIKSITKASKSKVMSGKLKFLHLDLNDLLVVKAVAKRFSQQEDKLDVLWNNAGTGANMVTIGQRTVQDFEPMIGMHCIATLLFTKLVLPQLRAAATSDESGKTRVAWTPSALAKAGSPPNGLDFDLLDKGTNRRTDNYGTSKAGNWILSREIACRYAKNGIVSVCLNLGFLDSLLHWDPCSHHVRLEQSSWVMKSAARTQSFMLDFLPISRWKAAVRTSFPGAGSAPTRLLRDRTSLSLAIQGGRGLDYGNKLWAWCEGKWNSYV